MNDNKSSGQFPAPGVAVILLALGVFIFSDTPFQPTRPAVSNILTTNNEDVRARLWQDPFEAVDLHRKEKHRKNSAPRNLNGDSKFFVGKIDNHTSCIISDKKNVDDDYKILSEYDEKKDQSTIVSGHDINQLLCQIQWNINIDETEAGTTKGAKKFDLHILAVMTTGGPYAEDKETRIRSRYAVTTGLLSTGYVPVDSENIGYMYFPELCDETTKNNISLKYTDYCNGLTVVPYEHFKLSELSEKWKDYRFAKNILVLWLDDETISKDKPLDMLSKLKNNLTPGINKNIFFLINYKNEIKIIEKDNISVKFDVIGPASSTSLVKMHINLNSYDCKKGEVNNCKSIAEDYGDKKNKIRVFSPRTTLDDDAIKKILGRKNEADSALNFPGFHRTIATDSMLVDNLLCEMLRRGINPFHEIKYLKNYIDNQYNSEKNSCTNYSIKALNKFGKKDFIVLIGEWDTTYSRNFNVLFREKIKHTFVINASESTSLERPEFNWLYSFYYLRGLDGEIARNNNNSSDSKNKDSSKNNTKQLRRSTGENQFDYLRRLAGQISDLSDLKSDVGSIKAIGIVGSDAYDKLLILQALRNRFPDVLFFTTDLDARMLHKDENKWVRNLVVASAFGLSPENTSYTYQGLNFRDSYQTALYNTIQKIVNSSGKEHYKTCVNKHLALDSNNSYDNISTLSECISSVKIFEIGNDLAVDYSHDDKCTGVEGSRGKCDYNRKYLRYAFLSLGLVTLLALQTSNKTRLYIFSVVTIICLVALWLNYFDLSNNKEFHSMFTGTSVWPAYIIRMVASIMAVMFIIYAIINLKINTIHIIKQHNLSDESYTPIIDRLRNNHEKLNDNFIKKYFLLIRYTFGWFFHYEYYDEKTINNRDLRKPRLRSYLFITTWEWEKKRNDKISIDNLFYQYIELSKTKSWLTRVVLMSILYYSLSICFILSFPSLPITPFVGEASADAKKILFAVLIPYIFLIFLSSDITRLHSRFVELLSRCIVTWSKNDLFIYCNKYGLSKEIAIEKLKLDLIVVRSKVVDKLIFLPFIILTLMILSRSSYFDRWHTPPQLAVIILLGACIALSSAIRLRKAASNSRIYALKNLNDIYNRLIYKETNPNYNIKVGSNICNIKMSERLQNIIKEIEDLSTGPFSPITKHPIIVAIMMPFGGVGGLYLIEYLTMVGM